MAINDKGRAPAKDATPKTTDDSRNHTSTDQLLGWLTLAKPSRNRPPKRGWQRGGRK